VLGSQADRVDLLGIDRWIGGTHATMANLAGGSGSRLVRHLRVGPARKPCVAALSQNECPRPESNQRTRFRKPSLYPLSYGGARAV
jgi:hypothetical protein